jgi:hypothetical protein
MSTSFRRSTLPQCEPGFRTVCAHAGQVSIAEPLCVSSAILQQRFLESFELAWKVLKGCRGIHEVAGTSRNSHFASAHRLVDALAKQRVGRHVTSIVTVPCVHSTFRRRR